MKLYTYTILTIILSLFSIQTDAQDIFIGTWEHQENNTIFRVLIWEDVDDSSTFLGHYEKVEVINNKEVYIYCSDKEKYSGNNNSWSPAVIIASGDNQNFGGRFIDNTVDANIYSKNKIGHLDFDIITNSGGSNPIITARWKVERKSHQGVICCNESPEFSVPTDIILTKAN